MTNTYGSQGVENGNFNNWSPVCSSVWEELGHMALLEQRGFIGGDVALWVGFDVSKAQAIASSLSMPRGCYLTM